MSYVWYITSHYMYMLFFAGDLVALFDDDETDEVKQERNEVDMLSLVFLTLIKNCSYL